MVGSVQTAWILLDKGLCALFPEAKGLPFATTVIAGASDTMAQVEALWRQYGPLIAKPAQQNGSRGVRLTLKREQVRAAASSPGWVLQPYLDTQPEWRALADAWQPGLPLWIEVPERSLYGAQFLIDLAGLVGEAFGYVVTQTATPTSGRPTEVAACDDPELLVIEANRSFTGTTPARWLLGCNEVGQALAQWPGQELPMQAERASTRADRIIHEQLVAGSAVQRPA